LSSADFWLAFVDSVKKALLKLIVRKRGVKVPL